MFHNRTLVCQCNVATFTGQTDLLVKKKADWIDDENNCSPESDTNNTLTNAATSGECHTAPLTTTRKLFGEFSCQIKVYETAGLRLQAKMFY